MARGKKTEIQEKNGKKGLNFPFVDKSGKIFREHSFALLEKYRQLCYNRTKEKTNAEIFDRRTHPF